MKRVLALLFFLSATLFLNAQSAADTLQKGVESDPRLQTLVTKHTEANAKMKKKGYRVQIYFGADKAKAKEMKARFLARFADEARAYEIYEVPNFKIRVGNFRTRMEAYRFLKKIKDEFPTAFIVESEVEFE